MNTNESTKNLKKLNYKLVSNIVRIAIYFLFLYIIKLWVHIVYNTFTHKRQCEYTVMKYVSIR